MGILSVMYLFGRSLVRVEGFMPSKHYRRRRPTRRNVQDWRICDCACLLACLLALSAPIRSASRDQLCLATKLLNHKKMFQGRSAIPTCLESRAGAQKSKTCASQTTLFIQKLVAVQEVGALHLFWRHCIHHPWNAAKRASRTRQEAQAGFVG